MPVSNENDTNNNFDKAIASINRIFRRLRLLFISNNSRNFWSTNKQVKEIQKSKKEEGLTEKKKKKAVSFSLTTKKMCQSRKKPLWRHLFLLHSSSSRNASTVGPSSTATKSRFSKKKYCAHPVSEETSLGIDRAVAVELLKRVVSVEKHRHCFGSSLSPFSTSPRKSTVGAVSINKWGPYKQQVTSVGNKPTSKASIIENEFAVASSDTSIDGNETEEAIVNDNNERKNKNLYENQRSEAIRSRSMITTLPSSQEIVDERKLKVEDLEIEKTIESGINNNGAKIIVPDRPSSHRKWQQHHSRATSRHNVNNVIRTSSSIAALNPTHSTLFQQRAAFSSLMHRTAIITTIRPTNSRTRLMWTFRRQLKRIHLLNKGVWFAGSPTTSEEGAANSAIISLTNNAPQCRNVEKSNFYCWSGFCGLCAILHQLLMLNDENENSDDKDSESINVSAYAQTVLANPDHPLNTLWVRKGAGQWWIDEMGATDGMLMMLENEKNDDGEVDGAENEEDILRSTDSEYNEQSEADYFRDRIPTITTVRSDELLEIEEEEELKSEDSAGKNNDSQQNQHSRRRSKKGTETLSSPSSNIQIKATLAEIIKNNEKNQRCSARINRRQSTKSYSRQKPNEAGSVSGTIISNTNIQFVDADTVLGETFPAMSRKRTVRRSKSFVEKVLISRKKSYNPLPMLGSVAPPMSMTMDAVSNATVSRKRTTAGSKKSANYSERYKTITEEDGLLNEDNIEDGRSRLGSDFGERSNSLAVGGRATSIVDTDSLSSKSVSAAVITTAIGGSRRGTTVFLEDPFMEQLLESTGGGAGRWMAPKPPPIVAEMGLDDSPTMAWNNDWWNWNRKFSGGSGDGTGGRRDWWVHHLAYSKGKRLEETDMTISGRKTAVGGSTWNPSQSLARTNSARFGGEPSWSGGGSSKEDLSLHQWNRHLGADLGVSGLLPKSPTVTSFGSSAGGGVNELSSYLDDKFRTRGMTR